MDHVISLLPPRLGSEQPAPSSLSAATVVVDHRPLPGCSDVGDVDLTLPLPPQLPPRGQRPVDQNTIACCESHLRPCPPIPPAPPLPAREPLHGPLLAAASSAVTSRRKPASCPATTSHIDQVVPLAKWPLPLSTLNTTGSVAGGGGASGLARSGLERTHVTVEPFLHRGVPPRVGNASAVGTARTSSPSNVAVATSGRQLKALEQHGNEYVDGPSLRSHVGGGGLHLCRSVPATGSRAGESWTATAVRGGDSHRATIPTVVVTQPTSKQTHPAVSGCVKDKLNTGRTTSGGGAPSSNNNCQGGITCSRCGLCRCANCTARRELPRRWIGDFECSIQRCVAVTSCLCCVQAVFYHCLDGSGSNCPEEGGIVGAADDPCACCERPGCLVRWTIMGALAMSVLPCLCCYCPMQCAVNGLTFCYKSCATPRGCQCRACSQEASSSGGSTHGLLADSESSST